MNFGVNRPILASGIVIVSLTIAHQGFGKGAKKTGLTRILMGADIACLVLAFVDMIPGAQPVTTALALLAMLTSIIAYGGDAVGLFSSLPTLPGNPPAPSTLNPTVLTNASKQAGGKI